MLQLWESGIGGMNQISCLGCKTNFWLNSLLANFSTQKNLMKKGIFWTINVSFGIIMIMVRCFNLKIAVPIAEQDLEIKKSKESFYLSNIIDNSLQQNWMNWLFKHDSIVLISSNHTSRNTIHLCLFIIRMLCCLKNYNAEYHGPSWQWSWVNPSAVCISGCESSGGPDTVCYHQNSKPRVWDSPRKVRWAPLYQ